MKYKAEIDTSAYKDFKFFEDGIGKYLVCKDAGAGYHYILRNVKKARSEKWRHCML